MRSRFTRLAAVRRLRHGMGSPFPSARNRTGCHRAEPDWTCRQGVGQSPADWSAGAGGRLATVCGDIGWEAPEPERAGARRDGRKALADNARAGAPGEIRTPNP